MATYTENFDLIKPDDEDYYDVADFNANMDIIDEALAESVGGSDKIGEPEDSILSTVFGKLNGFISPDGKGVRTVKSIQRVLYRVPTSNNRTVSIAHVDTSRCLVLYRRYFDRGNGNDNTEAINYTLNSDSVSFSHSSYGADPKITVELWIIEFY